MFKGKTMKRSLIIGMGIGQLYRDVLLRLGHEVVTVDLDPTKGANFTKVDDALEAYAFYDTVHICTPNFTHKEIAKQVAYSAGIVFVEKPGFASAAEWKEVCSWYGNTRFMMVKNNMWRDPIDLDYLQYKVHQSKYIILNWINKDRVPNPGTWFTTKSLAYGGVSRDLMPHLLSLFVAMNDRYDRAMFTRKEVLTKWKLSDLTRSDYGTVKADGTYDVDDYCQLEFKDKNSRIWILEADWRRAGDEDDRAIHFVDRNYNGLLDFELGLCPESAYEAMIKDAIEHYTDNAWWMKQYSIDLWIHEILDHI